MPQTVDTYNLCTIVIIIVIIIIVLAQFKCHISVALIRLCTETLWESQMCDTYTLCVIIIISQKL